MKGRPVDTTPGGFVVSEPVSVDFRAVAFVTRRPENSATRVARFRLKPPLEEAPLSDEPFDQSLGEINGVG